MKFTVPTKAMLSELKLCLSVIGKKPITPISGMTRVSVSERGVALEATNLSQYIAARLTHWSVELGGSFCCSAKVLYDYLCLINEEDISFEIPPSTNSVRILAGTSRFHIALAPLDQFPTFDIPDLVYVEVPDGRLISKIKLVAPFAYDGFERMNLNAVRIQNGEVIATDGHRLAIIGHDTLPSDMALSVPSDSVRAICSIFEGSDNLLLAHNSSFLYIKNERTIYGTKLVSTDYPNIQGIIPKGPGHCFSLPRAETILALKRLSVLGGHDLNVRITMSQGQILLTSSSLAGELAEMVPILTGEVPADMWGINGNYLQKALESINADTVDVVYSAPLKPIMLKHGEYTHVIMPVRIT